MPILKRRDFLAAAKATTVAMPGFLLQARARPVEHPEDAQSLRLGLTASKKVGGAVIRNRARRRLRAIGVSKLSQLGRPGWDYVLVARATETVSRAFDALAEELQRAIDRAHAGQSSLRRRARSKARSRTRK